ncbi:MAG: type II CAAX prenyl endopeptidase Rce1 family protein [Planctomycetia bacterium]
MSPGEHGGPSPAPPGGAPRGVLGGLKQLLCDLRSIPRGALAVGLSVPVLLTLLDYLGMPWHYTRALERAGASAMGTSAPRAPELARWLGSPALTGNPRLDAYAWWGLCVALTMIVLPLLVARVFAGLSPRDVGLRLKGTLRELPTYALLYLLFVPVVWWVSRDPHFQRTYPFFRPAGGPGSGEFLLFQAIYCLQFLGVELFFRGFIVLGLKRVLGIASVLLMLAPYCMIHYYKPLPEALGSIGAGLLLGLLSWRSGTVVYGWLLHYAVALTMDLLALGQAPAAR